MVVRLSVSPGFVGTRGPRCGGLWWYGGWTGGEPNPGQAGSGVPGFYRWEVSGIVENRDIEI